MNSIKDFGTGLYVGAKYSELTLNAIEQLQHDLKVPNPVPREKIHSTIAYSRVNVPYIAASGSFEVAKSGTLETWKTDKGNILVLKLDSDYLRFRHNYARAIGATHDFPEYTPHITLSYNIGPMKYEGTRLIHIVLAHEYTEPLQLDWA